MQASGINGLRLNRHAVGDDQETPCDQLIGHPGQHLSRRVGHVGHIVDATDWRVGILGNPTSGEGVGPGIQA
jgi:hypothetical protein